MKYFLLISAVVLTLAAYNARAASQLEKPCVKAPVSTGDF
jgi:hypothetical protein